MSNGHRYRKTFGQGKLPELRVPRSRRENFYPILLALLRNREEEARKPEFNLCGAGFTTEQVGEIFGDIYGKQYSPSQISRLFEYARSEVQAWSSRPLKSYYPIILIDATFIYTRKADHVNKEAYYTILGVRKERSRQVLGTVNSPTESAQAWEDVFDELKSRVLQQRMPYGEKFPSSQQLCSIHLQRNVQKRVKPKDKVQVAEGLKMCSGPATGMIAV